MSDLHLDEEKVLKMAVVHDVAESRVGDRAIGEVYQEMSNEDRMLEEDAAWESFTDIADVTEFKELWEEMENRSSPEGRFVADMDLIDMCLTALKYEKENRYDDTADDSAYCGLDGFFETADKNVQTDIGRDLFEDVHSRYKNIK